MKKAVVLLLILSILTAIYATPAFAEGTISMTILVKDELGNAVAGATVMVFDSLGTKVAEGTTNSSGYVKLSIPNATVTFIVKLATAKFILNTTDMTTVNTTEVHVITLDASTMNYVSIRANASGITAKVAPVLNSKVVFSVETNATVYGTENLNVTFPEKKVVMPFVEVRLEEITVDGQSFTNTTSVIVDLSSANKIVTAGYVKYYTFTRTWETYAIIAFVAVLFIVLMFSFIRETGKTIMKSIAPKKYVKINSI